MRRTPLIVMLAVLGISFGCADALDLPEPPHMQAKSIAYDRPSGRIDDRTAEDLILRYSSARDRIDEADQFQPITDSVEELTASASTNDEGTVEIDDAPVQADAIITLSGRCPGWDGDDERGDFEFRMIVRDASLIPVLWGEINACRGEQTIGGETLRYEYSGTAAIFVPAIVDADEETTFLVDFDLHHWTIDGEQRPPWASSFRLIDGRLEMMFTDDVGSSFVLSGDPGAQETTIRGANGVYSCNLEYRECTSEESSDSFSY